jgi:two-component system, NarL family, nitrate/nitrite response regulator NarL
MPNATKNPIRIAILDNHTLVRAGMRKILEGESGLKVVGEAGNLDDGLALLASQKPDLVLLELNLAEESSTEIIPALIRGFESTCIILVTGISDPKVHQQAVEAGVMGVVFKTQTPETLLKAIDKVNAGEVWLERSMIANVLSRLSRNHQPVKVNPEFESITQLSDREKQIIRLIGQGYKNKKISSQLCISETTVRHHLTSIYSKLGVSDRLELLVYAHRYGLVNPPE